MSILKIKPKNAANNGNNSSTKNSSKNISKAKKTVQELLDIQYIRDKFIQNTDRSKYFIKIDPKNINIFNDQFLLNEIESLKDVCNVSTDIEFLVVDKVERLEDNKNYTEQLLNSTSDETYRMLLEKDLEYFKELETSKGSSREFYFVIPFKNSEFEKVKDQLTQVEQALKNKGFTVLSSSKNDLKNMLQVYLERNFTGDIIKDFDINFDM